MIPVAVGDGVTDDSAAFQAAISASPTIYVPTPAVAQSGGLLEDEGVFGGQP